MAAAVLKGSLPHAGERAVPNESCSCSLQANGTASDYFGKGAFSLTGITGSHEDGLRGSGARNPPPNGDSSTHHPITPPDCSTPESQDSPHHNCGSKPNGHHHRANSHSHIHGYANGHRAATGATITTTNGIKAATAHHRNSPSLGSATDLTPPSPSSPANDPIAICGMALRLPGGIHSPSSFWDLLVTGGDARGPVPASRYSSLGFSDALGAKYGDIKTKQGYFLSDPSESEDGDSLGRFDAGMFSVSRAEVERMDPQQRILLEVVRECLEDAGEVNYRGKGVGCYVGTFGDNWLELSGKETQHDRVGYMVLGSGDLMISNRVSYEYDFRGPSMTIKTGCSASLIALHSACRAISSGDCPSGAIVAGTSLILSPSVTSAFTSEGLLSPDGSCKTFDAAANGFARAEAVNAVFLKPLSAALRDGNPVRAVIRGSATNSDGRGPEDGIGAGLLTPNGEAHEELMRKVYRDAGLDPKDTAFVECHGTGTPTGDPIEANAVANVFGSNNSSNGIYIGSVKPNVGHGEGSSGITSIIKGVLALENGIIPGNIKFNNPNPKTPALTARICMSQAGQTSLPFPSKSVLKMLTTPCHHLPLVPFKERNLLVPTKPTPFPAGRAHRLSVNSFGIGGANAHVILEAYDDYRLPPSPSPFPLERLSLLNGTSFITSTTTLLNGHVEETAAATAGEEDRKTNDKPELLVFSANTPASVKSQLDKYGSVLKTIKARPLDVAYTLSRRRERLPHRAYTILQNGELTDISPLQKAPATPPAVYLVFNGQGGQWPGMAKELIQSDAAFRHDILAMDDVLQSLIYPPTWTIVDELQKPKEVSRINEAELSQPLCTAVQIALYNRLSAAGVKPSGAVGHSSGEIAAVYASGLLPMDLAIIVAYYRGFVTKNQGGAGAMAAIGMGAGETRPYLADGVVVACENSPSSSTISGPREKVLETVEAIKESCPGVLARALKVNMGYHSTLMKPLAVRYSSLMYAEMERRGIVLSSSSPFISTVSGELTEPPRPFGPEYWAANLTSPVKFSGSVSTLLARKGDGLFVEIGPHSTLAGPLRQICSSMSRPCEYVSSIIRGQDCIKSLYSCIGKLFQAGVDVDFSAIYPAGKVVTGLPTYSWDHSTSFWYESRLSSAWRQRKYPHHSLLGDRSTESPDTHPQWRNVLRLEDEPWLADHKVKSDLLFPFAGYIAIAGEAVRQATGHERCGFSLRHVVVRTGLVLSEHKNAEMITSLRKHMLTDNDESGWWNFSISSYTGSSWVLHCDGRVKAVTKSLAASTTSETLPRSVTMQRFYNALESAGIVYGPQFQRLHSVSSATIEKRAVGKIRTAPPEQNKGFVQHPAVIDTCLQVLLVALSTGLERNIPGLSVPTCIEELDVGFGETDTLDAAGWGESSMRPNGVECVSNGKVTVRISGVEMTPLDDENDDVADPHAGSRLEWTNDVDFLDLAPYIEHADAKTPELILLEEMTLLCMLENTHHVQDLAPCQPHYDMYRKWLERESGFACEDTHPIVANPGRYYAMSREERVSAIESKYQQLLQTDKKHLAIGTKRMYDSCGDMFVGHKQTIDILMQDGVLKDLYNSLGFEYGKVFKALSNTYPTLRILEVGAGTGGATSTILPHLVDDNGNPMFSMYTYTDISAGFFPEAKERFASYVDNMEFKTFDLERAPCEQGISLDSYDVVVAFNVVHATSSLKRTLGHLNKVLKPGGRLMLIEASTVSKTVNYIFGNFVGWWLGEADNRLWEPYVSVDRWDQDLKAAGFDGASTVVYDDVEPYQINAAIISQRLLPPAQHKNVVVMCSYPRHGAAARVISQLKADGRSVTSAGLGEAISPDVDVVSCVDLESNFFQDITRDEFAAFQALLNCGILGKILWLTSPVQIACHAPQSAPTIGVARTVRAELGIPFCTLEISTWEPDFSALVSRVFKKVCAVEDERDLSADREYAVHDGKVCVGRYHPVSVTSEFSSRSLAAPGVSTRKVLGVGKAGLLETLGWREEKLQDVPDGHVEFEPVLVGLNFRDVLLAMGVIPPSGDVIPLGLDGAATVTRLGASVEGLEVGDRVMFFTGGGALATRVHLPFHLVVKIPDSLKSEEAATVPTVFVTALMAMLELGRLEKGMSVLIQAATGGVGLAACQIARMVGAEIYVTAGTKAKEDFLVSEMGIPRSRIFPSRDAGFVDGIMRETGGKGVDLVLNSASGELLHASWKCVAEFGTMVDIAKRDMLGHGSLGMRPFSENRTYAGYEGKMMLEKKPERVGKWMRRWVELYGEGKLWPIEQLRVFGGNEIEQAFRFMQGGHHIGKILVRLESKDDKVVDARRGAEVRLDPEGSYLLTGGFGGLGRSLITWLVERGAKNITVLSRGAGNESNQAFVEEVESMGCAVTVVSGMVDDVDDVRSAVEMSRSPIKGVFHLAMVLRDASLQAMTYEEWIAVTKPKIQGAWNLHNVLLDQPLDIFWLASSLVTSIEQTGQGNYSAANTFMEAFTQYRHSLGLPCSVLGICPIKGIGFVAENEQAMKNCKQQDLVLIGERELLDFVSLGVVTGLAGVEEKASAAANIGAKNNNKSELWTWSNSSHVVSGMRSEKDLDDPSNKISWRLDRRMGLYHNAHRSGAGKDTAAAVSELQAFLSRAKDDSPQILTEGSGIEFLAKEIGRKLNDFMIRAVDEDEVDVDRSPSQLGLDSLMATELRRWFSQTVGVRISVLEVMGAGSLRELGKLVGERVGERLEGR
ncbi:putative polyketide synthase [Zalerion maritima]|uniref:Polyketide synthase n=1 Tax=Zalerion maritima TaxID=339359 RepID=A0AAD5RLJ7_9PEZI|nr:putative polyketide synthase [Zalerion maritima]